MIKSVLASFATAMLVAVTALAAPTPASAAGTSCLPGSIKAKLSQIRAKFGPVSIVSAHRPGARIRGSGKRSLHASCRAVDFHPPKGKYSQVVNWLKSTHSGGVGTYSCGMHHIHIDNGPRVRFHHCVSANGTPVGKKRNYANGKSGKQYAKNRHSKKRYAKSASRDRSASSRTLRRNKVAEAKKSQHKRGQHAANQRWSVNNYAAF